MQRNFLCVLFFSSMLLQAGQPSQGPKLIPPPGVDVPAADRATLEAGVKELASAIEQLQVTLKDKPALLKLLPDVQIYHKAVHWALTYNEILDVKEISVAKTLLQHGLERAKQLAGGSAPWTSATGLVVRGYLSRIDGSIQPYGMVVPAEFKPTDAPRRLDFWFHGRAEKLTELAFVAEREKQVGEFKPDGAFVLHTYGRFCNANKYAGEVDLFEALEHARANYPVDENRLVVRGFSMGGAACWQFAVHHAGLWAAAAPGAGFSETAKFSNLTAQLDTIPWYEKTLWHMCDSTDYALNLFNCPTIAYSGEIDKQKQAADEMVKALAAEKLEIKHVIGLQTAHKYHPDAKKEIEAWLLPVVTAGRNPVPKEIKFTTWTLRYNQLKWLTVDAMGKHWDRARVDAEIVDGGIKVASQNVTALTLNMPAALNPLPAGKKPSINIDGQTIEGPAPLEKQAWTMHLYKEQNKWQAGTPDETQLRKRHGLQGPIDDAFMDSFIFVRPTGKPLNETTGAWVKKAMQAAADDWRRYFRGQVRFVDDTAVTEKEMDEHNLVLWGDPSSNAVLAKIAAKLPIVWDAAGINAGKTHSNDQHVAELICPNPLKPKQYVVLNSGYTFSEHSSGSNARHVAVLPDWAIIDVTAPHKTRVKDAGFFGERWELTPPTP